MNYGIWERPRKVDYRQPRGVLVGHNMGEAPMVEAKEPEAMGPAIMVDVPMSISHLQGEGGESGKESPAIRPSASAQESQENIMR